MEENSHTCYNMDEFWGHDVKWNNANTVMIPFIGKTQNKKIQRDRKGNWGERNEVLFTGYRVLFL